MLHVIEHPTRHLFFTGKGGVGKTSLATATAVALADSGKRVLLVSTDPASNLGQVLEAEVTDSIGPVPAVPGLSTFNINPEAAAAEYRERVIGPVRGLLPDAAIAQMTESLSGACTTEIASFDAFTRLLTDPALVGDVDHVVFDTAPTGHTLRLLQLPAAWSDFIETNPDGASCLGPASGLQAQRAQYAAAVQALGDREQTTLVLVTRPESSALAEAARSSSELAALGVKSQQLVVNGVFSAADSATNSARNSATDPADALATAIETRQREAMERLPAALRDLPLETVSLKGHNLVGIAALRALVSDVPLEAREAVDVLEALEAPQDDAFAAPDLPPLSTLVDEIEADGKGLVMVMGKGGVGKTTLAAAVAVELLRRGHPVHLSTTDPAAHLEHALADEVEGLTLSRIDPREETRRYTEHVLTTKGKKLDADGLRLLEEDLRSPCTEEVAVFQAFSQRVREATRGFVVLDTAPTGHTLLLLDQTGAYHREVARNTSEGAGEATGEARGAATGAASGAARGRITTPLMRLQDPSMTKLIIATLPETTPVLEAAGLQADLRRAGIEPFAWVVNQSLAAARPTDPLLSARAHAEAGQLRAVVTEHATRVALVPMTAYDPVGPDALQALVRGASVLETA